MLESLIDRIKDRLVAYVKDRYEYSLLQVVAEQPPRVELGDLAFPFCFELARHLRRAPRQIATEIVQDLPDLPGVAKVEVAGPGYLNCFLKRDDVFRRLLQPTEDQPPRLESGKIILEHTNINPNKAAHIGHLRNAVLGDTFARLLRSVGEPVEVQNYIDDTGVQVADVVVGFKYLEKKTLEDIQALPGKFDYYCWDLYARVSSFYEAAPENRELRGRTLREIEAGEGETAAIARYVSRAIVRCHLATMSRIGVAYDLLPKESDILHLNFWSHAFQRLKEAKAIHYETDGRNRGCWVMRAGEYSLHGQARTSAAGGDSGHEEDKIIVRSNGTVTYVGKDIAYQLWKLGLLGMDFFYRPFHVYPDGHRVMMTSSDPTQNPTDSDFGRGERVYNVIDSRQSYLQNIVVTGLRALGFHLQAERSIHFSYEMVGLSPACCQDLGIRLSEEDRRRPYVEVSGRKGLGVKADDLIDRLREKSAAEVQNRHPQLPAREVEAIAHSIAVGALRYFLLKYTRNSIIAFDFREALSFEGETGPYLQYTVVRINSIFRKVEELDPRFDSQSLLEFMDEPKTAAFLRESISDDFWTLIYLAAQLETQVRVAIHNCEPAGVAKYLFNLAQALNHFYHRHRIKDEPDPVRKGFYLALITILRNQLQAGMDLLGISVPDRM
ncbi:MAG: arginine--tRNA ligase [Acidobacteria bacterium]|nr:arginine--tRNA ligase [Acidobacteriota bacterium]